jgi:hypothetical protein
VGVVQAPEAPAKKAGAPAPPPDPPAPYVPFQGLDPTTPRQPWYHDFLSELAARGLMMLAASKAGVHRRKVYRHMAADPELAAEVEVAREYFQDYLEWQSVTLGQTSRNPLPFFARLKAERPARYIDRQAVFLAGSATLDPAAGQQLLRALLGQGADLKALREGAPLPDDAAIIPVRPADAPE